MGSNMTQIQALVSPTISLIIHVGERKFHAIFTLGSESSRGRKFHGTKWVELSLPGAKVGGNEGSSYHHSRRLSSGRRRRGECHSLVAVFVDLPTHDQWLEQHCQLPTDLLQNHSPCFILYYTHTHRQLTHQRYTGTRDRQRGERQIFTESLTAEISIPGSIPGA